MQASKSLIGQAKRDGGADFEKDIEDTFENYAKEGVAFLDFMNVPMRPCGIRHPHTKAPLYMPAGKAPYDVYGYVPMMVIVQSELSPVKRAVMVGAELKADSKPTTSLPIVKPKQHGHGIAFHQLDALAQLAQEGGISRIVWNNGGQVGILREAKIVAYCVMYAQSLKAEESGRPLDKGVRRSIPWSEFEPVEHEQFAGEPTLNWLALRGAA